MNEKLSNNLSLSIEKDYYLSIYDNMICHFKRVAKIVKIPETGKLIIEFHNQDPLEVDNDHVVICSDPSSALYFLNYGRR